MGRDYSKMVDEFLISYTEGSLKNSTGILADDIMVNYSNLGKFKGKAQVMEALRLPDDYDVKTVTTSNRMEYSDHGNYYVALVAHHLLSFEKYNEMFPLLFGGKYVFTISESRQLITSVSFVLEYQAENTVYVKDFWEFADGFNDYNALSGFDLLRFLKQSNLESDKTIVAAQLSKLFFWCLDTEAMDILEALTTADFVINRAKVVGSDKIVGNHDNLSAFIKEDKSHYDLSQYSVAIDGARYISDTEVNVTAQHLTPHRPGNKKLNSLTKYHTFFDEDIELTWIMEGEWLKLKAVTIKRAADLAYYGYKIKNY
ncbi:hypothetical protein [Enterocloster lavalensis]|uniref:hypothetical protein n=1 Tax=Enterocloster lavalensis TaxID=460384 RepID=UPI001D06ABF9|nr:hypothetical protein [Enterocloster lavalensis]MCB6345177.1 hypothetical protein [Enterocloster lavalensis]